ncbi:MAG: hypothetical protein JSS02_21450, partial [Planctomycetes bacterium]|nr:hypothetical protein [Planctomycetota bacterium]
IVGDLSVASTGVTRTNNFASNVFDGTSDGTHNYTINYLTGEVIALGLDWGGPVVSQFTTGILGDLGITYDAWHDSLWIQNFYTGRVTEYTLQGHILTSFLTDSTNYNRSALAMDVDHTLWYADFNTNTIVHYSTAGEYLGSSDYAGLLFAFGGEIAVVPEPTPWLIFASFGILVAVAQFRRWLGHVA